MKPSPMEVVPGGLSMLAVSPVCIPRCNFFLLILSFLSSDCVLQRGGRSPDQRLPEPAVPPQVLQIRGTLLLPAHAQRRQGSEVGRGDGVMYSFVYLYPLHRSCAFI
jgi:hypothetical protein